ASLEITVPSALLPLRPYIRLDRDHRQKFPDRDGPVLPVDPTTGKALLASIGAGDHVAFVFVKTSGSSALDHRAVLGPFGPIRVVAGTRTTFVVDAAGAGLASVQARVLVRGRDSASTEIVLRGRSGDLSWFVGPLGVAADGVVQV